MKNKNVKSQKNVNDVKLDRLVNLIKRLVSNKKTWSGSMTDLVNKVSRSSTMPNNPISMRSLLNRVVNRLSRTDKISTKSEVLSKPLNGGSRRVVTFKLRS